MEIGNRGRTITVLGVEVGKFLLGLGLDPVAPLADFIGEVLAVSWNVFEDDLVDEHGDWIEIAGKGICPNP